MRTVLLHFLMLTGILQFMGTGYNAHADIRLPNLVGSNMVLQRNLPIHVWGWADPGEKITITFNGKDYQAIADASGDWEVYLKKMKAGGPYKMILSGKNQITLENILIGDVWVCSGQSNMDLRVVRADNADEEIKNAYYPNIRLFKVKRAAAIVPQEHASGQWVECTPENIPDFSAVGYYFGRDIHKSQDIPIGLLNPSWGGTPVETWTSLEGLQGEETFGPRAARAKALDVDSISKPNSYPTLVYNGMIHPLINFPIKGVVWYQGESNGKRAYQYRDLFPRLIVDWRAKWNQGDFPFLFVQLPNYLEPVEQPGPSDWAELREAQDMTLRLRNTGMASAIDLGEADNLHPTNKQDVGRRLALVARKISYGDKVIASGPRYQSMKIKGNEVYIKFLHVGKGLKTKTGSKRLNEFQVAGTDQKFHWAEAEIINKNTVRVYAEGIAQPAAVRFAWQHNPSRLNLYNTADLPANPFRTDDWPGVTMGKK